MGKKKARSTPAKDCKCDKCGLIGHAIPGTLHRRCSSNAESNAPLPKGKILPPAQRGRWN